ncbi:MAG TPA: sigma-70 family RNA polymerase sigma factor [Gemmatimonadales bacterium]|nr:sigma-70 family RNA polymerase sigma factor [Gemmatimonadales bacterium]
MTDESLVAAMARGDEQALGALYDRYAAGLNGLALRMVREPADAEEVVADAFAQAWREAHRFDGRRGPVSAWMVTMTRSRALDLIRARGRRARLKDEVAVAMPVNPVAMGTPPAVPSRAAEEHERADHVQTALRELPSEQLEVVHLAYFEGLSQREIATRLDTPLGTVKTRARLALARLRNPLHALAPEGQDD